MRTGMLHHAAQQPQAHGGQRALPQRAGIVVFGDKAPLLRGHGTFVPAVSQVVDRATGNRVAAQNRPLHRRNAPVAWQQRRVVAHAAQTGAGQCVVAYARMGVGRHDHVGTFGNGLTRHHFGVSQHVHGNASRAACVCQAVVRFGCHHAAHFYAGLFQQGRQYRGTKILRTNQGNFHQNFLSS